ncbi:unnamed protein product [Nippostrongylus brasiliensis]|uniref:DUF2655 domain-containing protein n=1 Tax=Nippostrongylus brasiliensis TaxID=27835 RepID=A0A0N4YN62_NIPBR|nr:unnamed protein product [Nippostrongylus brasiliensis]
MKPLLISLCKQCNYSLTAKVAEIVSDLSHRHQWTDESSSKHPRPVVILGKMLGKTEVSMGLPDGSHTRPAGWLTAGRVLCGNGLETALFAFRLVDVTSQRNHE